MRSAPVSLVTLCAVLVGASCMPRARPEVAAPLHTPAVRMLLVNDVYVTDTMRNGQGGVARVAALRDSLERASGSRVLFVLAGDVLSPSVLSKFYHGAQMVDAFNAARLDYAALGNHEFDLTGPQLLARLGESRFQWTSGNCGDATTGGPFPNVRGWDTLTVSGVKVGLFSTTLVMPYSSWVQCRNPDSSTTALVDTLVQNGAQLVVGLTHRTIHDDSATLARDPRIHAILGGHEHDGRRDIVNGRLLIKAASNVRTAAFVTFQRDGSDWTFRDSVFSIGSGMREDPATRAVVRRWSDSLVQRVGPERVVGISEEPMDAVDSTSRRRESRFGNLITDALRAGTNADVALMNSGALRLDDIIPAGPITNHVLESIFLFADETRTVTFNLTGARLREVLEHGIARGSLGGGPHLQVSGVRFSFDARRESGSRIIGDVQRENGSVIAPTDTLRVTFVYYPACRGGDGYRIPEAAAACAAVNADAQASPRSVDLVMKHLEAMGGRIVQPPTGRVTRIDRR